MSRLFTPIRLLFVSAIYGTAHFFRMSKGVFFNHVCSFENRLMSSHKKVPCHFHELSLRCPYMHITFLITHCTHDDDLEESGLEVSIPRFSQQIVSGHFFIRAYRSAIVMTFLPFSSLSYQAQCTMSRNVHETSELLQLSV
jgi:hypothetical protein